MKQTKKELKYALYLIRHPFKGFWDIKHEGYGSLKTAIIILTMTIITQILSNLFSGYLFIGPKNVNYNLLETLTSTLSLFAAWSIINWSLTCLNDGKGTLKDIVIATSYSLLPFVIVQLPLIILSNVFVLRELSFYNILNGLSYTWLAFLLVVGQIVTHQYSLARTMGVMLFTIIGIVFLAVLIILFFNLGQQVIIFISIVFEELMLRLSYS